MNKRYSLNKMSGMTIAAGGLAVGGFTLPGFRFESARASDALLRTKHSPGVSGAMTVIDVEASLYYGDRVRLVSAPVIPNMDKIKVDLSAFWAKVNGPVRRAGSQVVLS